MIEFYKKLALLNVHKCAGVYIWRDHKQQFLVSLVVAYNNKGEIIVNNSLSSNNLDEIIKEIPTGVPLIVVIDGTNVVHKIVPEQASVDQHVAMALPGAKAKDFFIRRQLISEERIIISLLRQSEVEHLVKVLNSAGLYVWEIYLGPFVLETFLQVQAGLDRINIPFYSISFENGKISDFERTKYSPSENKQLLTIGSDELTMECLVPFASCLKFFKQPGKDNTSSLISEQRKEFIAKRVLAITLLPFILLVFVTLFVNFLLFMDYEKETRLLDKVIINEGKQISEIDSLKKAATVKQNVLETKLKSGSKYLAYFSDRIASIVPSGIILQEMVINPQITVSRGENSFEFAENKIIINGITDNSISLEIFVNRLSSFMWIESTSIRNFNETKEGVRIFNLELKLADYK